MKKTFLVALLLAAGGVLTSQAVVIHWATDGYGGASYGDVGSAFLVYVSSGTPAYAGDVLTNGEIIGGEVTGLPISPGGVWQQDAADGTPRSAGAYYVVLLHTGGAQYSYSTTALVWNDTTSITWDEMAPAPGVFAPDGFTPWAPIPEPGAAALLAVGAAVAALRRRKRT
jgi:hypothetical protein